MPLSPFQRRLRLRRLKALRLISRGWSRVAVARACGMTKRRLLQLLAEWSAELRPQRDRVA